MDITKNKIGFISAIGLAALGIWLLFLGFGNVEDKGGMVVLLISGGICIILGIYMFFNLNKEDQIEQIKTKEVKNE